MEVHQEIQTLSDEIRSTRKILTALGDEMRQHLILVMMQSGDCSGMRVNDIAEKTRLSRPAVSHHLQILKDAGIVKMRRVGTKNYYYFDADIEERELFIRCKYGDFQRDEMCVSKKIFARIVEVITADKRISFQNDRACIFSCRYSTRRNSFLPERFDSVPIYLIRWSSSRRSTIMK